MVEHTLKRISRELEDLIKHQISVERALDLLEASSHDLEELIAINTMRESMSDLGGKKRKTKGNVPAPTDISLHQPKRTIYHALA
ncbi:MAG: hypothetical protein GY866_13130 [Proteobacteria bacterium]|nr:hypothetical protein [Pseudomonadota bacterium]